MRDFVETSAGNPGRGGHRLSRLAGQTVESARRRLARLIDAPDAQRVVFTLNATDALHLAIDGTLAAGDHALVSPFEHNSVMRPLREWEARGVEVETVPATGCAVEADEFEKRIKKNTKLIVCTHASNVSGVIMPVGEIAAAAARHGAAMLVDAAQTVGHVPVDVKELGADFVAFSGHKGLMGPTGVGALYVKEGARLRPVRSGGTGIDSALERQPEEFPFFLESGTPNTAGLAGLEAAIEFIERAGLEAVAGAQEQLIGQLAAGAGTQKGLWLVGGDFSGKRVPVLSLAFEDADPHDVAAMLDAQYGIAVRAGLHCAPAAHRALGTFPEGTLRVSPGYFNTAGDVDYFLNALGETMAAL